MRLAWPSQRVLCACITSAVVLLQSADQPQLRTRTPHFSLKPNQYPCGARKEFCAMGDCVSMYCPVLRQQQQHKLSSEDFILCDDRDVFCAKHADVGIKKCRRCSNGFDDVGKLDKQCCDDCCEMVVLTQLF